MIVTRKSVGDGGPCFLGISAFRRNREETLKLASIGKQIREERGCMNLVNPEELTGNPRMTS